MDKSLLDGLPSLKGTTGIEIILLHTGAYGYHSDWVSHAVGFWGF